MASNANLENNGQPGTARGTFPIRPILDESESQDSFLGSLYASRALEIIQGDGGISETLVYVEDLLKNVPLTVIEAQHSEEGEIELKETHANNQQALFIVAGLAQQASWQASTTARN